MRSVTWEDMQDLADHVCEGLAHAAKAAGDGEFVIAQGYVQTAALTVATRQAKLLFEIKELLAAGQGPHFTGCVVHTDQQALENGLVWPQPTTENKATY